MNVPLDELPQDMDQTEKEKICGKENNSHELLRELDPEGVKSRKRKRLRRRTYHANGPNLVSHIDGS